MTLLPIPEPACVRIERLDDGSVVLLDAQNHVLDIVPPERGRFISGPGMTVLEVDV